MFHLPSHYEPYTDTYFLRSLQIIQSDKLNQYIRAQIFIRKGPGKIYGINEVLAIIRKFSKLQEHGGRIYSLSDGDIYQPEETIMILEGPAQDIIPLETIILGVLSAETTIKNDHCFPDMNEISKNVKTVVDVVGDRPVYWFGARHWRYDWDFRISKAAFDGGAIEASTDIGANANDKKGIGTIPHSLECIYAFKYGFDKAVIESLKAFDRIIDTNVPRIALVDFQNKEIDDALLCARTLGKRLYGIRVDTCGENSMQGGIEKGVSIQGVYTLRKKLDENGFQSIKIILSSGFGNIYKTKAFIEAERQFHTKLFDALGIGEVFTVRSATMDVVGVGSAFKSIESLSKAGRRYRPNNRLTLHTG